MPTNAAVLFYHFDVTCIVETGRRVTYCRDCESESMEANWLR